MNNDPSGSAFPYIDGPQRNEGISRREWYATHAPEPTASEIEFEGNRDRDANPHGDSYKPRRRGVLEIRCDLRFKYADAMIAASKRMS